MSHVTMSADDVTRLARAALERILARREQLRREFCAEERKPDWIERLFRMKPDTRSDEEIIRAVKNSTSFGRKITYTLCVECAFDDAERALNRLLKLALLGNPVVVTDDVAVYL